MMRTAKSSHWMEWYEDIGLMIPPKICDVLIPLMMIHCCGYEKADRLPHLPHLTGTGDLSRWILCQAGTGFRMSPRVPPVQTLPMSILDRNCCGNDKSVPLLQLPRLIGNGGESSRLNENWVDIA